MTITVTITGPQGSGKTLLADWLRMSIPPVLLPPITRTAFHLPTIKIVDGENLVSAIVPIDWSKPLEHIDGTPVRLDEDSDSNPDRDGDYWLVREDGKRFTKEQQNKDTGAYSFVVDSNGVRFKGKDDTILIRNRQPDSLIPATPIAEVAARPAEEVAAERVREAAKALTEARTAARDLGLNVKIVDNYNSVSATVTKEL